MPNACCKTRSEKDSEPVCGGQEVLEQQVVGHGLECRPTGLVVKLMTCEEGSENVRGANPITVIDWAPCEDKLVDDKAKLEREKAKETGRGPWQGRVYGGIGQAHWEGVIWNGIERGFKIDRDGASRQHRGIGQRRCW